MRVWLVIIHFYMTKTFALVRATSKAEAEKKALEAYEDTTEDDIATAYDLTEAIEQLGKAVIFLPRWKGKA